MQQQTPAPREARLDVRGLVCPVPVLMTARVVADLHAGDRLEVVGDDPEIAVDLPAWCEQTGNRLLELKRDETLIRCRLEVAGAQAPSPSGRAPG